MKKKEDKRCPMCGKLIKHPHEMYDHIRDVHNRRKSEDEYESKGV